MFKGLAKELLSLTMSSSRSQPLSIVIGHNSTIETDTDLPRTDVSVVYSFPLLRTFETIAAREVTPSFA
jgi:hypothetical protein